MEMTVISISRMRDELHTALKDQEISVAAVSFTPSLIDAELSVVIFNGCEWKLLALVCMGARQPITAAKVHMTEHQGTGTHLIDEIGPNFSKVITSASEPLAVEPLPARREDD